LSGGCADDCATEHFLKVEDIALGKMPAQQLTAQLAALG